MARCFTLVELLVVTVIIALLASMLLPALAGAKTRAQDVHCLSNLRQFGNTVLGYCSDHDGYFVTYYYPTDPNPSNLVGQGSIVANQLPCTLWLDIMHEDYLGGRIELMECPRQEAARRTTSYGQYFGPGGYRQVMPGYGINRYIQNAVNKLPIRVGQFIDPAEKVLLADTGIGMMNGGDYPALSRPYGWAPISGRWAANAQGGRSGLGTADRHRPDDYYGLTRLPGMKTRGGSNHFFVDGHAGFMSWIDSFPWLRITADDPVLYNDGKTLFRRYWDPDSDGDENTP